MARMVAGMGSIDSPTHTQEDSVESAPSTLELFAQLIEQEKLRKRAMATWENVESAIHLMTFWEGAYRASSLGVKRSSTIWAVLKECGHQPLQYHWFKAADKLLNSMLVQLTQVFHRLRSSEIFERDVRPGGAISMDDYSADLRYRLQGVWREAESVDLRGNNSKLATYQHWLRRAVGPLHHKAAKTKC
eukprot:1147717-Pelagomonas_calceolata.AAC.2